MTLYAYGFAMDVAPFDDVAIRRAISAAIDRDALARELAAAGVEPATAILPPSAGGTPTDCPHCRHDPDLARELIDEWWGRQPEGAEGPRIVLTYPLGAGHVTAAELIASDIERHLGLEVRLQAREFGALVRAVTAGDAPLFRYGLRAPVGGRAAAAALLDGALRSDAPSNWTRWRDTTTDALLETWTPDSAPTLAREIEASVLDAAAIVPLLWTRPDLVVHPSLVGFRADPTGRWWPELIRLR
jgi:ABC-type transport system substrate-binding protein